MASTVGSSPVPGSRGRAGLFWLAIAALMLLVGSFRLAAGGGGHVVLAGVLAMVAGVVVVRRPVFGILVYLTTFLFTYPAFLRGSGNFTINNMLGLALLPLMLYGMLREGSWWLVRLRPIFLLGLVVACMIGSATFYRPSVDVGRDFLAERAATSLRAQGDALISTRDESAKFLTRYVFLVFLVYFVRTPRDMKMVAATIVGCLLATYFSVSAEEGIRGWGTGRLRVMGEAGTGLYAGRNPNKLAYFALYCLTLLWYARRTIRNSFWYVPWGIATALVFMMIPLTGSRSGILNLLLFLAIVMLEGKFNYRKLVGLTTVALFFIIQIGYDLSVVDLLFPSDVAARLTRFDVRPEALELGLEGQGSAEGRIQTAMSATQVFRTHWLFGVGIGNFNYERAVIDPFGIAGPPHNSYLWALSEGGIVGFVLYSAFFFWVWKALRNIEWEYEARFGPLGLGWLVNATRTAMIGFLFFSFFADMWHHVLFYIVMGFSIAVIRAHKVYAETGQVPAPFVVGKPVTPVGFEKRR
jgi:O-antigen ligase